MKLNTHGPKENPLFKRLTVPLFIIFTLLVVSGCSSSGGGGGIPTVAIETDDGNVQCLDGSSMVSCKGIPYALPPTGARRFAPPVEITTARAETLDATEYCNTCPQSASAFGDRSVTEDCLYLNVFIPKTGTGPFPVMVWIHGGAFISGSSGTETYDPYNPAELVAEGLVVVTINYRIGPLGFLPHAALTAEAGESGNYGLMDQHMALNWIQDHIADFDGDPDNVTLFGESAGGHSVLAQLVNPSSYLPRYLFHKAIVQSGAYAPSQMTMEAGYIYYGYTFAEQVGCTTGDIAECLRDLTVEELLDAQDQLGLWPSPVYADGAFLEKSIQTVLEEDGIPDDVPIISGCNKDEGQLFTLLDMSEGELYLTEAAYDVAVAAELAFSGLDADAIGQHYLDHYSADDTNRFRKAISEFRTDYMFVYNNKVIWDQMSDKTDVYAYWFTDEEAPVLNAEMEAADFLLGGIGATHSFEIQYIFGSLADGGATQDQIALSDTMIGYWTSFAKNGDPGAAWDTYTAGDEFVLKLDDPTPTATDVDDADGFCDTHECSYWESPPTTP